MVVFIATATHEYGLLIYSVTSVCLSCSGSNY